MFWVVRSFVWRSGALTGRRDDLFFLQVQEILAVLAGDRAPLARVPPGRPPTAATGPCRRTRG